MARGRRWGSQIRFETPSLLARTHTLPPIPFETYKRLQKVIMSSNWEDVDGFNVRSPTNNLVELAAMPTPPDSTGKSFGLRKDSENNRQFAPSKQQIVFPSSSSTMRNPGGMHNDTRPRSIIVPGASLSTNKQQTFKADPETLNPVESIREIPKLLPKSQSTIGALDNLSLSQNSNASEIIKQYGRATSNATSASVKFKGERARRTADCGPPLLAAARPMLVEANKRTTRSAEKARAKQPVTIDLLESDEDDLQFAPSNILGSCGDSTKSRSIEEEKISKFAISPAWEAECIVIGLVPYLNKCGFSIKRSHIATYLQIWGKSAFHDMSEEIEMTSLDPSAAYSGEISPSVQYLAWQATPYLHLKCVAVGEGRVLTTEKTRSAENRYIIIYTSENAVAQYETFMREEGLSKRFFKFSSSKFVQSAAETFYKLREDRAQDVDLWQRREAEVIADMPTNGFTSSSISKRTSRRAGKLANDVDYNDPANRITYVVYPIEPDAVDAVTIYSGDLKRLELGVYFNDSLIDLKIKHLLSQLPPEARSRFHAFSCHFYSKLTERGASGKNAHNLVSRWTKSVNIFEKEFVLVPINLNNHWSLVVLVRPSYLWTYPNVFLGGSKSYKRKRSRPGDDGASPMKRPPVEIDDIDSTPLGVIGERVSEQREMSDIMETRDEQCIEDLPQDRPCLLFMDSLSMHPYTKIGRMLQSYVYYEYLAQKQLAVKTEAKPQDGESLQAADKPLVSPQEEEFQEDSFREALPLVRCAVPTQSNSVDCGVFVCRYAKMVMESSPPSSNDVIDSKYASLFAQYFTQEDITADRKDLRDLLEKLSQDWKDARAMAGIAPNTEPVPAEVVQATQEGTVGDDGGKPSPTDGEQSEPVLVNSEQDELADEPGDSCAGDTNADPSTQSQCSDLIVTEEGDMNIDDATDDTGSIMSEPLVQSPGLDEPSADNDGADDRKEETSPPEGAIVGENNPMEQSSWRRAILQLENKNL